MSVLPVVTHLYHDHAFSELRQVVEASLARLEHECEHEQADLLREATQAWTTAVALRATVTDLLALLLPRFGYGHVVVDQALRRLSETTWMPQPVPQARPPRDPGEAVLTYPLVAHVVDAPAFPLAPESLIMLTDAHDLERGIVLFAETLLAGCPQLHARYPYLPVQAVPEGVLTPDLIVELWDGAERLATRPFCTIWRGMQRSANPATWERVSYPTPQLALEYNRTRLSLCPYCWHLHRQTCLVAPAEGPFPVDTHRE